MIGKIWGMNPRILIFLVLLILCLIPPASSNPTVTIVAAGDQRYYGGEEIKLSGTNAVTDRTYLFLIGPNVPSTGGSIKAADPKLAANKVVTGDDRNFQVIDVQSDKTWSWTWNTSNVALEAGTYTIYAVSAPKDKNDLSGAAYGMVSMLIFPEKPLVWATASPSPIKKGEKLIITGCAQGQPSKGIQIWVFGKNYSIKKNIAVNSDESFKYEITQEETKNLSAGEYYIVIQHPMQNNVFDIDLCTANPNNVCHMQLAGGQTKIFSFLGMGCLQGLDAAEALTQGINESNVDDTSLKIQFSVVEPATTTPSVPTTVSTTAITTTIVPTTSQTTAVTSSSTTTPITTLTTSVTTSPSPTLTTAPTDSVQKLLEEQNRKIEEQNKKLADLNKTIAEQNQKLSEQNDILTQIINFLKSMFGWK